MIPKKYFLGFVLITIACAVLLSLLAYFNIFGTWQLKLSDSLYGVGTPLDNIVVISIDDKSLQEIGRWPWPRSVWVPLIEKLQDSKVVGFDVSFFEPTEDDKVLADVMRSAGNVVIPVEYNFDEKRLLKPVPAFENITTAVVNVFTDIDGITRSVPFQVNSHNSFAFVLAEKWTGRASKYNEQKLLVNYAGGPGTFQTFSASDVISGRISDFENKIVLIGATAPDLHDDYLVPTSRGVRMPGVEIHANALQTVLTKRFLKSQSFASVVILIFATAFVSMLVLRFLRNRIALPLLVVLLFGYFVTAVFLFYRGLVLNLVYPPLTIIATSLFVLGYSSAVEARHKKHILSIFGKYVPKDIVTHLVAMEKHPELGGVEREITVMFADIRGFTPLSEKLTPHQAIGLLNHYFGGMVDCIFAQGGTLDKFLGDALMAVFNSPLKQKDHALKCVKAALAMQKALKKKHSKKVPPIKLGIGINTGPAVIGNMGSPQRLEFTAIGDTVNTASRLCGVAKGGEIIISEATYEQVKDCIKVKKLAPVKVKGKEKPLVVYQVLGQK